MAMKEAIREMEQQQRDLDSKGTNTKGLQLIAKDQIQVRSVYDVDESCTEVNLRVENLAMDQQGEGLGQQQLRQGDGGAEGGEVI